MIDSLWTDADLIKAAMSGSDPLARELAKRLKDRPPPIQEQESVTQYAYLGRQGRLMVPAVDIQDALDYVRKLEGSSVIDNLMTWDGSKYVPVVR